MSTLQVRKGVRQILVLSVKLSIHLCRSPRYVPLNVVKRQFPWLLGCPHLCPLLHDPGNFLNWPYFLIFCARVWFFSVSSPPPRRCTSPLKWAFGVRYHASNNCLLAVCLPVWPCVFVHTFLSFFARFSFIIVKTGANCLPRRKEINSPK